MQAQQDRSDHESRGQREEELEAELAALSSQLKKVEGQLARQAPECAAKVAEAEQLKSEEEAAEARLQQLYAKRTRTTQFRSRRERDEHLKKEMSTVTAALEKKEVQAASLQRQLEEGRSKASRAEVEGGEARVRLAAERAKEDEARAAAISLREKRDKLTDARKRLWRKEQEVSEGRRSSQAELEKARRTLQHSMSRQQWEAVSAVKRIAAEKKIKGVLGMLIELFEVDDKFFTAVEAAAGNQLFQIVVDTDDTASVQRRAHTSSDARTRAATHTHLSVRMRRCEHACVACATPLKCSDAHAFSVMTPLLSSLTCFGCAQMLLKGLQNLNAGRVTFMPLNRLKPGGDAKYPDSEEAIPVLSRLSFRPIFRPAMAEIFRRGLVVRSLEVGARFARCGRHAGEA